MGELLIARCARSIVFAHSLALGVRPSANHNTRIDRGRRGVERVAPEPMSSIEVANGSRRDLARIWDHAPRIPIDASGRCTTRLRPGSRAGSRLCDSARRESILWEARPNER